MLKSWRFWVGIAISVVCLYLALQGIQLNQVADALRDIDPVWLVPATVLFLVSYVARVFRWQLLFWPDKPRFDRVFDALNIGYFLSNLLPARMGDIVRGYLIGDVEGISKVRALSTVVVERMTDGLTVVLLLGITAVFVPTVPEEARQGAIGVAAAGCAGILVLLLLVFQRERGMALLHRIASPFSFLQRPSLWRTLESVVDGFSALKSPRALLGVAAWSLVAWALGGLLFWSVMRAMHLDLPMPAAFLVMTVTSLVVVVPSSPGYIGVFHFATWLTLSSVYNVDKTAALSYALVEHAFTYLWLVVLGLSSIWREGLSYERLQAIQREETE